ncbi:MAG: protein phosphatase CheZ [Burkholderiales bacterium]|nr:protein phosphatase CheZ [Burkholderiales bacterium]
MSEQEEQNAVESGYNELGHLVRQLHATLHELGCDEAMQSMVGELPDTQDRLNYIVQLTEQAAQRVLSAVEKALPLQEELESSALVLAEEWRNTTGRDAAGEKILAFLDSIPKSTRETSAQLTDILMAQEFQDLTGQVIKKITRLAQDMEHHLVNILLISRPDGPSKDEGLMNGPVVRNDGRGDSVSGQGEVDDLLNELGF